MALRKLGIPPGPSQVLTVPGRKSGQPRSTPMTPFDHDGGLYTVAGYPGADWAANARAAGTGTLTGPQVATGEDRRTHPGGSRPVLRASRSRCRSASASPSGRASSRRHARRIRGAGRRAGGVPVRPGRLGRSRARRPLHHDVHPNGCARHVTSQWCHRKCHSDASALNRP